MRIIVSRHGNTFEPGVPTFWVGSRNDLPLVAKGREQAETLADALIQKHIKIDAVYCGPLKRTKEYATIVCNKMKLFLIPKIDPRLNELDYGNWSGHTNQEVIEKYGEKVFKDWEERGVWPHDAEWGSSREDVIKELAAFVVDLIKDHEQDETILIVSSTGRIRHLLKLSNDVFDPKVKTGNVCELSYKNGELTITSWNIAPEKL